MFTRDQELEPYALNLSIDVCFVFCSLLQSYKRICMPSERIHMSFLVCPSPHFFLLLIASLVSSFVLFSTPQIIISIF